MDKTVLYNSKKLAINPVSHASAINSEANSSYTTVEENLTQLWKSVTSNGQSGNVSILQNTGDSITSVMSLDAVTKALSGLLLEQRADKTPFISKYLTQGDTELIWELFNLELANMSSISDPFPYNGNIRYYLEQGLRVDVVNRVIDSSIDIKRRLTLVVTGNIGVNSEKKLVFNGDIDLSFWRLYANNAWSDWMPITMFVYRTSLNLSLIDDNMLVSEDDKLEIINIKNAREEGKTIMSSDGVINASIIYRRPSYIVSISYITGNELKLVSTIIPPTGETTWKVTSINLELMALYTFYNILGNLNLINSELDYDKLEEALGPCNLLLLAIELGLNILCTEYLDLDGTLYLTRIPIQYLKLSDVNTILLTWMIGSIVTTLIVDCSDDWGDILEFSRVDISNISSGSDIVVVQETGNSTTSVMSLTAVTEALSEKIGQYDLSQSTGLNRIIAMSLEAITKALAGKMLDLRADDTPFISKVINEGSLEQTWEAFNEDLDGIVSFSDPLRYNGNIRYYLEEGLRVDAANRIINSSNSPERRLTLVVTGNIKLDDNNKLSFNEESEKSFYRIYKEESWSDWNLISLDIVQETGNSTSSVMSQKAITTELNHKINLSWIVQSTGNSDFTIMSQKAVTEALKLAELIYFTTLDISTKSHGSEISEEDKAEIEKIMEVSLDKPIYCKANGGWYKVVHPDGDIWNPELRVLTPSKIYLVFLLLSPSNWAISVIDLEKASTLSENANYLINDTIEISPILYYTNTINTEITDVIYSEYLLDPFLNKGNDLKVVRFSVAPNSSYSGPSFLLYDGNNYYSSWSSIGIFPSSDYYLNNTLSPKERLAYVKLGSTEQVYYNSIDKKFYNLTI